MMSSRTSVMGRFPGSFGRGRLRPPRPAERAGGDEDSAEDEVRGPDPGGHVDVDQPEQADGDDRERGEDEEGCEQPEHDGPGHVLSGGDRLVANGRDDPLDVVDRVGRPVAHGSSSRPRTRRAYPPAAGTTQARSKTETARHVLVSSSTSVDRSPVAGRTSTSTGRSRCVPVPYAVGAGLPATARTRQGGRAVRDDAGASSSCVRSEEHTSELQSLTNLV